MSALCLYVCGLRVGTPPFLMLYQIDELSIWYNDNLLKQKLSSLKFLLFVWIVKGYFVPKKQRFIDFHILLENL